ncbi:OPT/YSL family transporter [candidate division KSB1 bacterium]|nr:OPT/YSL family transporter [candidate division KSB1 bacterium]
MTESKNLDTPKTAEQEDREWVEQVYRGDKEPQNTVRAVISGMLLGGVMSVSNVYVGLKSGWGLGVDIAAIIIIFALFKSLELMKAVKRPFGMMESTQMMTVAVAASWISSAGLVNAVPALTITTGKTFIAWQLSLWLLSMLLLGLFMAIPFKRQYIQEEKLKFPGNIPTGETIKAMYSTGDEAVKKAKALGLAGGTGIVLAFMRDGFGVIPGLLNLPVSVARVSLSKLTLSFEPSLIFLGIGAIFGMKVGLSMLGGLLLNYAVLGPTLINDKIILHAPPAVQAAQAMEFPYIAVAGQSLTVVVEEANVAPELKYGSKLDTLRYVWPANVAYSKLSELESDLNSPKLVDGSPNPFHGVISARDTINKNLGKQVLFLEASKARTWESRLALAEHQDSTTVKALGFAPGQSRTQNVGSFRNIVAWTLWPGATILVVGGLLALAFQWRTMARTFAGLGAALRKKDGHHKAGPMDHLELPMTWFLPGFLVTGTFCVIMQMALFSIHWYMAIIAVVLTFFLAAVAARAAAETSINPIGAMGKVTQLLYGVLSPGNMTTNLMTANITAGAAASCADTIGSLKVGHMVGANPRKQFIAQLFGVFAGAAFSVPAYYLMVPDATKLGDAQFPAPAALIWAGVARVLAQGLSTLPRSAIIAIFVALTAGIVIVVAEKLFPKIKPYTPSPSALGIAMTIPAYTSFSMFLGALIAWVLEKATPEWHERFTIAIASGFIAGESLSGVAILGLQRLGLLAG